MRRRRRIRSPHPGVVINRRVLPSGATQWRARYTDPDTGREADVTLDALALPTHEARTLWAKRKAQVLAARRMDLASGAPQAQAKPLADALADYRSAAQHTLRPRTIETNELAFAHFVRWAAHEGRECTSGLTRAGLASFREYLIARPRKAAKRGGKRGTRQDTSSKRSPVSVNRDLRSIKALLNQWRVAGLLQHVDSDVIGDTLKALPVPREQPEYLTPAKAENLLQAALRHDADVFEATREEHAGLRTPGTTSRYVPIAPFAAFLLLTGCRRGEALGLTWANVDLDAKDEHGRAVGEIRLRAEHTKTHRARTVGLEVSPALRALLAAMKLRAGHGAEVLHVFGGREPYTADVVEAARRRLKSEYGAPTFTWQVLRSTCATYLTNAPGIFGAATAYMSARQLGHSVAVAERSYLGVHRGIPREARTLEAAMQIEAVLGEVLATRATHPAAARVSGAA